MTSALNDSGTAADLRTTFEQGMRQLVPSCEIKLQDTPMVSSDGCDSIYFTVPTTRGAGAVLQATFDPEYEPALDEFKLLRAAAAVAAVIVQVPRTRVAHTRLLQKRRAAAHLPRQDGVRKAAKSAANWGRKRCQVVPAIRRQALNRLATTPDGHFGRDLTLPQRTPSSPRRRSHSRQRR